MKTWLRTGCICSLLLAFALPAPASTRRLQSISHTDHDGETVVSLALDGAVAPDVQMLPDHRLVIDLVGVRPSLRSHTIDVGNGRLVRIRVGVHHDDAAPRTRVVLDLTGPTSFDVVPTETGLEIDLRPSGVPRRVPLPPSAEAGAPAPARRRPAPTAASPMPSSTASSPPTAALTPTARPRPSPTAAPETDVPAAATAAPPPSPSSSPPEGPQHRPTEGSISADAEPIPGGLVTIDFQDADVRTVIDLVAAVGGYDVIFTPEVRGTVSVHLVDRPWDEALETVLSRKGLRATRHADLILVSPGVWQPTSEAGAP